nr:MAG TPA: hypothetical protein [Caudoviricetes sp.]
MSIYFILYTFLAFVVMHAFYGVMIQNHRQRLAKFLIIFLCYFLGQISVYFK